MPDVDDPVTACLPSVEHLPRTCGTLKAGFLLPRFALRPISLQLCFKGDLDTTAPLPILGAGRALLFRGPSFDTTPSVHNICQPPQIPSAFFTTFKRGVVTVQGDTRGT